LQFAACLPVERHILYWRSRFEGGSAIVWSLSMSVISRTARRDRGSVVVMLALTMVPVIAAVGAAIDYSRVLEVRNHLAAALDAGVLLVGSRSSASESATLAVVRAWVDAHMADTDATWTVDSVSEDSRGRIVARASGKVRTTVVRLFGIDGVAIGVESRGVRPRVTRRSAE
jgi:Flp pilus assembly protein TadG